MKRTSTFTLSLLAASLLAPALAHADTFTLISITDPSFSTFTFSLPHSPTPSATDPANGDFTTSAPATVTGPTGTSTIASDPMQFYTTAAGGGLADTYFFSIFGPQLFTGTLSAPTFTDGTFNLSSFGSTAIDYVLTISPATGGTTTPEPSSLVLLGTGVLGLAGAARRRLVK